MGRIYIRMQPLTSNLSQASMINPIERQRGWFVRKISEQPFRPSIDAITTRVTASTHPRRSQLDVTDLSRLIHNLGDPNLETASEAQRGLVSRGDIAVPALIRCFGLTPQPGLSQMVEEIGDEYGRVIVVIGSSATEDLVGALSDEEYMVRLRAVNALGRIEGDPEKIMPALLAVIENTASDNHQTHSHSSEGELIKEAGQALTRMPKTDPNSHPRLLGLLTHPDELVRETGYKGVAHHHPDVQSTVPALLNGLNNESRVLIQAEVVYALARYGKEDSQVLPVLLDHIKKATGLASYASNAIRPRNFSAGAVVNRMIDELNRPDGNVFHSVLTLGQYGKEAQAAIPFLIKALQGSRLDPRLVARALGKIAPDADEVYRTAGLDALQQIRDRFGFIDD